METIAITRKEADLMLESATAGILINSNGDFEVVKPNDEGIFTQDHLNHLISGTLLPVFLENGKVMFYNEDGKVYGLPYNEEATKIFRSQRGYKLDTNEFMVGNIILIHEKTMER